MCRAINQGGRRCTCTPEQLRAQQRAQYAVRQDARPPTVVPVTPSSPLGTSSADLQRALAGARQAMDGADALDFTTTDANGWLTPTERGLEAEARVRALGVLLGARADELAQERLVMVGQHPDLTALRPEGFASREEYVGWVEDDALRTEMLRLHREVMSHRPKTKAERLAQERLDQWLEDNKAALDESVRIARGECTWDAVEARIRSDSYREVLSGVRPMGLDQDTDLSLSPKSDPEAVSVLRGAMEHYPTEWTSAEGTYESRITYSDDRRSVEKTPFVVTYADPDENRGLAEAGHYQPMALVAVFEMSTDPWVKQVPMDEDLPEDGVVEGQGWAIDLRSMGMEGSMAFFPWSGEGEPTEEDLSNPNLKRVQLVRTREEHEVYSGYHQSELVLTRGSESDATSVAVHEYGHRMENVRPSINAACQVFLARRTMGKDGQRAPMSAYAGTRAEVRMGPPANPGEMLERNYKSQSCWTRDGGFVTAYTGLETGSRDSSEVFTTGMEGVATGQYGGLRGDNEFRADPEHRDLILGLLATC